jgi:TRAP-type mannitol/chloroaromatic compound transport system permease small subunit
MRELLGKFVDFVGAIAGFAWKAFVEDSAEFFARVVESPSESLFEALIALFLVGAAATMVLGIALSVLKFSPLPFIRAVERYARLFAYIGAALIVVLIVSMVYEVVSRYFFGAPTQWAFEMAYMLMGTSFMFGIAYCLQMRRHIRVDFVYDHVGLRTRAIIDLFGFSFLIPMLLWLCGGLWEYFHQAYRVDETSGESAWNPIIWPFKYSFVIGFVLLLMQTTVEVLKSVMTLAGQKVPGPETVEGSG